MIEIGIEEGATLVAGGIEKPEGYDKGYYVKPTVFANVTSDCISKCTKYDLNNKTIIVGGGGLIRKYFNKYTAHIDKQNYNF